MGCWISFEMVFEHARLFIRSNSRERSCLEKLENLWSYSWRLFKLGNKLDKRPKLRIAADLFWWFANILFSREQPICCVPTYRYLFWAYILYLPQGEYCTESQFLEKFSLGCFTWLSWVRLVELNIFFSKWISFLALHKVWRMWNSVNMSLTCDFSQGHDSETIC